MQIAVHQKGDEPTATTKPAIAPSRLLLWASAGLLETLCLLGGMYWIMTEDDTRPLLLRVTLVAALAVVCGVASIVAYMRLGGGTDGR